MMPHLPIVAFLALALAPFVALCAPQDQQAMGPVHTMDSWEWTDCGTPGDVAHVTAIQVSPDPPKPGKNLTVTVNGVVYEEIEDGAYADVTVKLGVVKLLQRRFDICEEALNANATVQCPIENGTYEVEQTVALPKEIPQAKFKVHIDAFTVDEREMVCLDITINFMKNPFPHFWKSNRS